MTGTDPTVTVLPTDLGERDGLDPSKGLTVEEADAIMGRPIGAPKTGIFGLLDLVGLDLMPHVDKSMAASLKPGDAYVKLRRDWPLLTKMIADGYGDAVVVR